MGWEIIIIIIHSAITSSVPVLVVIIDMFLLEIRIWKSNEDLRRQTLEKDPGKTIEIWWL